MKSEIHIDDSAECCCIEIEGTIGVPEAWQFEEPDAHIATYDKFREALRHIAAIKAPEVRVEIRSTGGDVNDALLIHDALRGLGARITTRCCGYTASAATIIAQAATEGCREISANALYLIHNASCAAEGNVAELGGTLEMLRRTDERIAAVYAARSGRPAEEFAALMGENNGSGRWLSPEEAVAAGLADKITDILEQTAPGAVRNFVRGWERFFSLLRPVPTRKAPADRNIFHTEEDLQVLRSRSALTAEETRRRVLPTRTRPREDPPLGDPVPTANQQAYAEDARHLRQA